MRVLLTAFEPFGGDGVNASADAAALVARGWDHPAAELVTVVLPVSFGGAPRRLDAAIAEHSPDVVVCLGEAGGRTSVTPELRAAPLADARIPDNDGDQPRDRPLDDVEGHLGSRVDAEALAEAIRASGVPADVSGDAGRFVCNAVFRAALTRFAGPACFIHVPAVRQAGPALVGAETDPGVAPASAPLTIDDLAVAVEAVILAVAAR